MQPLSNIKKELRACASDKRKKTNEYFFKTGDNGYAAHDRFIGVRMPDLRSVAQKHIDTPLDLVLDLLGSPIHEERMLGLLILTYRFEKSNQVGRKKIYQFYLKHKKHVNNWDLVDVSAHKIVGVYLIDHPKEKSVLNTLTESPILWDRRIAMVSTWSFIRTGNIADTLRLAKKLLGDKEDLMHKAVGWMLRESWKKDARAVEQFLEKNYHKLPRTTLRYAIERVPQDRRKNMLKGNFR